MCRLTAWTDGQYRQCHTSVLNYSRIHQTMCRQPVWTDGQYWQRHTSVLNYSRIHQTMCRLTVRTDGQYRQRHTSVLNYSRIHQTMCRLTVTQTANKNSVSTSQRTQPVSVINSKWLTSFQETASYNKWQNAEFPNVIAGGAYSYHGLQTFKEESIKRPLHQEYPSIYCAYLFKYRNL